MRNYKAIQHPTLFELGYFMHIITDISSAKPCGIIYDKLVISNKKRSYYDRVIIPLLIRTLDK
jgi:hypothetical protein